MVGAARSGLVRKLAVAAPILALTLGLSACADDAEAGFDATHAVVGSSNATDSRIVAEIYAAALRGTGKAVTTDLAVGDRADAIRALEAGRLTVIPDHTGALIDYFQPGAPAAPVTGPDAAETVVAQTAERLSGVLPEYLRVSDPALAQQQPALALATAEANRLGVSTIAELGPHCGALRLGVEPGMLNQDLVLRSLADADRCAFAEVVQVGSAEDARAGLAADEIQVAGTAVGAPGLDQDGVTMLAFPAGQLPAENVIPLFRRGSLTDNEIRALNKVAGELTTEDLADMVAQVDSGGRPIDAVVGQWLSEHGF